MAVLQRVYAYTDRPISWTRAIIYGLLIVILSIILLGQIPSWIIYKFDQEIATLIEWSAKVPGVNKAGLNSAQIQIIRDLVANGVQMGALVAMFVFAYIWQEKKRKRTGSKGLQDPVKGYLTGK